jgi:predicted nucleic-acid-binding protein
MIGVDTNVLLRLLLDDDPLQAAGIEAWLQTLPPRAGQIHIHDVVLAEVCWTLASVYQQPKAELVRALRGLLDEPMFRFDDPATLDAAVATFEQVGCGFADCLIVARNLAAGCSATATFDQRMARLSGTMAL